MAILTPIPRSRLQIQNYIPFWVPIANNWIVSRLCPPWRAIPTFKATCHPHRDRPEQDLVLGYRTTQTSLRPSLITAQPRQVGLGISLLCSHPIQRVGILSSLPAAWILDQLRVCWILLHLRRPLDPIALGRTVPFWSGHWPPPSNKRMGTQSVQVGHIWSIHIIPILKEISHGLKWEAIALPMSTWKIT